MLLSTYASLVALGMYYTAVQYQLHTSVRVYQLHFALHLWDQKGGIENQQLSELKNLSYTHSRTYPTHPNLFIFFFLSAGYRVTALQALLGISELLISPSNIFAPLLRQMLNPFPNIQPSGNSKDHT